MLDHGEQDVGHYSTDDSEAAMHISSSYRAMVQRSRKMSDGARPILSPFSSRLQIIGALNRYSKPVLQTDAFSLLSVLARSYGATD